tara:strand:+ start:76942 stop:78288 length:1347 start_codon:yes stop_codon:yes gene_type:complete
MSQSSYNSNEGEDLEPIDRIARPFQIFAKNKVSGAILLMAATVAALIWANSPWASSYHDILHGHVTMEAFGFGIDKPLHVWINDGLMAVFFFVVGLEIKREVLAGELATFRKALLPIAGALGGIVVPALIYYAINANGAGASGWGIPMATDIAFALGILLLLGPRVPIGLKVFLTALAIVDDIGAIAVIAIFYTDQIVVGSLLGGGALVLFSAVLNMLGVRNSIVYFIVGTMVWLAFFKSGVHATLASVCMAMTIPARTRIDGESLLARLKKLTERFADSGLKKGRGLLTTEQEHTLQDMERAVEQSTAPLQKLEHALLPIVSFVALPIFALANAGLALDGDLALAVQSPVTLGVIAGLVIGKQVGIFSFAWLAVRLGFANLPEGVSWRQIHAVAVLGGVGFTMALFVGSLAFKDPALVEQAKLGILLASTVAAILGAVLLVTAQKKE